MPLTHLGCKYACSLLPHRAPSGSGVQTLIKLLFLLSLTSADKHASLMPEQKSAVSNAGSNAKALDWATYTKLDAA